MNILPGDPFMSFGGKGGGPPGSKVCIMFLSGGRCEKGDQCTLKHPTDPDEIVHWIEFFKKTPCKWGPGCRWQPRCLYRHDGGGQIPTEELAAFLPGQPGAPQHKVCLMHLASNCDKGANCPLRHPEDPVEILQWIEVFKRVPCKWGGACKWAGKCIFAHPEGTPLVTAEPQNPVSDDVHAANEFASLAALADAQLAGEGGFQVPVPATTPKALPALTAPAAQFWPELQASVLGQPRPPHSLPPSVVPPPPKVVPPLPGMAPLTASKAPAVLAGAGWSAGALPFGVMPGGKGFMTRPPHTTSVAPLFLNVRPAGPVVVPPPPPAAKLSAPTPDIWAGFGEMPGFLQLPGFLPLAKLPSSPPGTMPSVGTAAMLAIFPPPSPGVLLETPPAAESLAALAPAPKSHKPAAGTASSLLAVADAAAAARLSGATGPA